MNRIPHAMSTSLKGALKQSLAISACLLPVLTQAQDKLSVRLDLTPWGIHAAMHLAQEKQWFAQEGLSVDVQDGTGTIAALQMVAVGHVDVGQVQLGNMAIAKEEGLDLISIAGWARRGDLAVMLDKDNPANSAKDLKGAHLVSFATSPWVPFIQPYLEFTGNADNRVTMVAPTAMVTTFASGNADGFMSLAPFGIPLTEKSRPAKALLLSEAGIEFPSYGLVVTPRLLEEKPAALKKLVQVQQRAWDYIYDGHIDEAVAAIVSQRPGIKLDTDVLKSQIEMYRPFFESASEAGLPFGVQSSADWAAALQSMVEATALKQPLSPDTYFTNALFDH